MKVHWRFARSNLRFAVWIDQTPISRYNYRSECKLHRREVDPDESRTARDRTQTRRFSSKFRHERLSQRASTSQDSLVRESAAIWHLDRSDSEKDPMSRLVRIDHAIPERKSILFVSWTPGNPCNYSCSYCPPALHNGSKPWIEARKIIDFSMRLLAVCASQSRTLYLEFSGGEVTLMPDFLDIIRILQTNGCRISVISNGTRSCSWWSEAVNYLEEVVLTFHPERASLGHFTSVSNLLSKQIRTHLNVAAPPNYFNVALAAARHLDAACQDVTILLKPMLVGFKDTLYPYTPEQLRILEDEEFGSHFTRDVLSARGDMRAVFETGETSVMESSQFLTKNLNHWKGWECDIGIEMLAIYFSGAIYRALCHEGGQIGHIDMPSDFSLPLSPIICGKETCSCLLDVMTSRRLP
jgi:organic radical activating enzyme